MFYHGACGVIGDLFLFTHLTVEVSVFIYLSWCYSCKEAEGVKAEAVAVHAPSRRASSLFLPEHERMSLCCIVQDE